MLGQRVTTPIPGQYVIQKPHGQAGGLFQGAQIEPRLARKWGQDKGRQVEAAYTAVPVRF